MQLLGSMMATVKDFVSSIGANKFARRVGGQTADFAKTFGSNAADFAKHAGGSAAGLAKVAGGSAVVLAKKVGPKRGLIGLGVIAAAVGGYFIVRHLRAHREEIEESLEAGEAAIGKAGKRLRKHTRARRKAMHAAMSH